ncbi:MAG: hypothetical protein OEV42_00425 [Deltaproteobacteria bacterium]|nr:hypothetical protein [Deltaproteobacteria bacterium]
MKTNGWVEIIKSIKTPISLLALITLIVGSLLHFNPDPVSRWAAIFLLFIITIFTIAYAIKYKSLFPTEIRSIWSKNDLPLEESERDSWLGKWNCRWTFREKDNQLKPYVDDIIEINEIGCNSGELTGMGFSSYIEGSKYFLKGRVSNKRIAHIFYTSSAETAGLSGMVILSRPPIGDITGWWLGAGRKGGDIGGGVTMERHENNLDFKIKKYEIS